MVTDCEYVEIRGPFDPASVHNDKNTTPQAAESTLHYSMSCDSLEDEQEPTSQTFWACAANLAKVISVA